MSLCSESRCPLTEFCGTKVCPESRCPCPSLIDQTSSNTLTVPSAILGGSESDRAGRIDLRAFRSSSDMRRRHTDFQKIPSLQSRGFWGKTTSGTKLQRCSNKNVLGVGSSLFKKPDIWFLWSKKPVYKMKTVCKCKIPRL